MHIERGLVPTSQGYIHYRAAGSGAPVVLLHMNQQSSAMYLELMAVLAPELRAIAIDYPSHGMSDHITVQPTQSWMDRINRAQIEAGRERWQVLDALHQYDMPGNLPRARRPVRQLTGEHFIYVKDHPEFAARMPDLRQHVIAGGRCCVGWEKAEDIGRKTLDVLR